MKAILDKSDSAAVLSARHEAMLLRLVSGVPATSVCQEFGITDSRLSVLRRSALWQRAEQELRLRLRKEATDRLDSLVGKAISALDDSVSDINQPVLRLQSAKEILNRTGFGPSMKLEQDVNPVIQLYIPKGWPEGDRS